MIIIITTIQGIECNTEIDTPLLKRLTCGIIYTTGDSYYLYCKSILLNGKVESGMSLYESEFPSAQESKIDTVDNYSEETRKLIPELGNEEQVSREITEQITLLPSDAVIKILMSEISKSVVDIGNSIILCKKYPFLTASGCTYELKFHENTVIQMIGDEIPELDNFYVAVKDGDRVLRRTIDNRGYPPSCGIENKGKQVVMIVIDADDRQVIKEINEKLVYASEHPGEEVCIGEMPRVLESGDRIPIPKNVKWDGKIAVGE